MLAPAEERGADLPSQVPTGRRRHLCGPRCRHQHPDAGRPKDDALAVRGDIRLLQGERRKLPPSRDLQLAAVAILHEETHCQ